MDTVSVLSSVSKVAFVAFGITLVVVVFEAYLLLKNRVKTDSISVPEFKGDPLKAQTLDIKTAGVYEQERQKNQEDRRKRVRLVSYLVSLAVLLGVTIIGVELVVRSQRERIAQQQEAAPVVLPTHVPTDTSEPVSFEEFGLGQEATAIPSPTPLNQSSSGQAPTSTGSPEPTASASSGQAPTSITIAKGGVTLTLTPTDIQTSPTVTPQNSGSPTQKTPSLPVSGIVGPSLFAIGVFMMLVSIAFIL